KGDRFDVNDRLCEMIGYSREELLKLTFQDITHPEDLNADLELLYETIRGERQTYQIEKRYFHKNGEEIHALLSVSAVRDTEDKLLYFISQIIDITDLKHAQAQIEKLLQTSEDQNERLKNFAHIVSHNLRSHSGGMVQLLEFLEIESPEYFQNELVKLLKQASDNLKETIEHLTQIVNVNLQSSYPKKAIILYDVVEKTLQSLQMTSQKSDVKLINEVDPALKVMAIPAYLDSIVLNFLTNGIKYQDPDKNSFVKVKTIIHPDTIEIQFEDNGLGIDLERYSNSLFGMYKTFHKHDDSRGVGL
ncbi:MAG TPA: histidine kinase, partial [Algoriphagus sp.]|nr:histidine kinase [Algoriphagus sp.]